VLDLHLDTAIVAAGRQTIAGSGSLVGITDERAQRPVQRVRHPRPGGGARARRPGRRNREARIEQIGSPRQIYDHPATPFVYEFLGSANRLPCRVRAGLVEVAGGSFVAPAGLAGDGPATLYVRPHDLAVDPAGRSRGRGMAAVLTSVVTTGPTFRLQLRLKRAELVIEAEMAKSRFEALALAPGAAVALRPLDFGLFPEDRADQADIAPLPLSGTPPREAAVA
jgi:hypothetical protein